MDQDKENVSRYRISTKIPIPKQPLPPLPNHLITSTKSEKEEIQRGPLRTLNHANADAGTSESNKNWVNNKKRVHYLNTKHVTKRRPKYEPLNWNLNSVNEQHENVCDDKNKDITSEKAGNFPCKNDHRGNKYTDDKIKHSTVSEQAGSSAENQVSSTNTAVENKDASVAGNLESQYVWESSSAVTPAIQSLEHREVRNIKRSLKRPHSRELQVLSLVENQDKTNYIKFKRRLEFKERSQNSLSTPDLSKKDFKESTCLVHSYTPDIFKYLLSNETRPLDVPKVDNITRACVINWLIKVNGPKGNPGVVQSASWYLDSILGIYAVSIDKLQLVAAACYWIARKLNGTVIAAGRLVKLANNAFNTAQLKAAEKSVMEKLGDRYALLVVVPRTRDGLTRLAADLPAAPLSDIQDMLGEEEVQVSMPTFYVETTTKPIAALAKFGVSSIFTRDADLTGVSSDEGLFVQELVQHVAVRVDNADSSATEFGVAEAVKEETKNLPLSPEKVLRRFNVEHPFIFFIVDVQDHLVVVAGKVTDPEQPAPFEF